MSALTLFLSCFLVLSSTTVLAGELPPADPPQSAVDQVWNHLNRELFRAETDPKSLHHTFCLDDSVVVGNLRLGKAFRYWVVGYDDILDLAEAQDAMSVARFWGYYFPVYSDEYLAGFVTVVGGGDDWRWASTNCGSSFDIQKLEYRKEHLEPGITFDVLDIFKVGGMLVAMSEHGPVRVILANSRLATDMIPGVTGTDLISVPWDRANDVLLEKAKRYRDKTAHNRGSQEKPDSVGGK